MNNIDKNIDRYWTVEEIRPHIINELQKRFPDSIIMREFDKVDIMVLGKNIPIEIQRTRSRNDIGTPRLSCFEDEIRRQIEQDIEIYGQCWFFFDAKFLIYLKNSLNRQTSINMDWLYQFYKSEKARIFTITVDGIIKELVNEDFSFIVNFSNTCILSRDEDHRILQRNKSNVAFNVLKGHGFTTDEINNWYDMYMKNTGNISFRRWLIRKENREKELASIINALYDIIDINEMLNCTLENIRAISNSSILGLIEGNGNSKYTRIRFIDKDDISRYFPGYIRRKELWDYLRTHTINHKTFIATIKGEYDYLKDYKNQKSIVDAWK